MIIRPALRRSDKLLDYNIGTINHVGTHTISSATDNFKQFYKALLYASLEGMAELSDEEMSVIRFIGSTDIPRESRILRLKLLIPPILQVQIPHTDMEAFTCFVPLRII